MTEIKRQISIDQMRAGIECFVRMGDLLGRGSTFYIGAIEGVNKKMDIEMEAYLQDSFTKEGLIAEAAIQGIQSGAYLDMSNIKKEFEYEHWAKMLVKYAQKYNVK